MEKIRSIFLLGLALALCAATPAAAAPGDLDRDFGNQGKVLVGGPGFSSDLETSVEVQVVSAPGGRIYLLIHGPEQASIVARKADGSPERGFGVNGRLSFATSFAGGQFLPGSIAVDASGRLVVAGAASAPTPQTSTSISTTALTVARYLPDGSLDPSFGSAGFTQHRLITALLGNPEDTSALVRGVAIDGYGRIVVAGSAIAYVGYCLRMPNAFVARFGAEGALDPSFGVAGVKLFDGFEFAAAEGLALSSAGAPAFYGAGFGCRSKVAGPWIERLEANGTGQPGFGEDGRKRVGQVGVDIALATTGETFYLDAEGIVTKLSAAGHPTKGFHRGAARRLLPNWEPRSLALTGGGRAFVVGTGYRPMAPLDDWITVMRLDWAGRPDRSFGDDGLVRTRFRGDATQTARDAILDRRSHLLVAALVARQGGDLRPALFRYDLGG